MIKPLNKTKAPSQPWEDVLALNVPPARYAKLFEAEPPENLGMNLTALVPETADPKRIHELTSKMISVGMTMQAMFENDAFRTKFAPGNMRGYTVDSNVFTLAAELLGTKTATIPGSLFPMIITVSFFDADQGVDPDLIDGCSRAIHMVERIASAARSYEPADHTPFSLPKVAAIDYRQRVGDLYNTGRGVWCRELVPLGWALKAGIHFLLDERPLVQAMRNYLATGQKPTPPRFRTK